MTKDYKNIIKKAEANIKELKKEGKDTKALEKHLKEVKKKVLAK